MADCDNKKKEKRWFNDYDERPRVKQYGTHLECTCGNIIWLEKGRYGRNITIYCGDCERKIVFDIEEKES